MTYAGQERVILDHRFLAAACGTVRSRPALCSTVTTRGRTRLALLAAYLEANHSRNRDFHQVARISGPVCDRPTRRAVHRTMRRSPMN